MNLIIDDVLDRFNQYESSKLIVTGLDRAGKTTFLNRHFPEYSTYKSSGHEYYDIDQLFEEFKVFDRHPAIEPYVYSTLSGNEEVMLKLCEERLNRYKGSVFIFFLYPRYRSMRKDEFDLSNRDELFTERYLKVSEMIYQKIDASLQIIISPNKLLRLTNKHCISEVK